MGLKNARIFVESESSSTHRCGLIVFPTAWGLALKNAPLSRNWQYIVFVGLGSGPEKRPLYLRAAGL